MYTKKNLPKSQYELSKGVEDTRFSRANDVRRDDDTLKELRIGLFDLDYCIKWYFDNVIRPQITEFGKQVPVPVMHGAPEKWKNMQADGYFRDKNGKIQTPLISFKRTSVTKNKTLGSKVDANFPQLYFTEEIKYGKQNKYDQFSVLTNSKPIRSFVTTVIPEFVDVTYDVIVWTEFEDQMNNIVEPVIYTEGSFWGDPERFKFRTKIDSFTNTTDLLQDQDRVVRTAFTITMFGYIIPDTLAKNLSKKQSSKAFDSRQITIDASVDVDAAVIDTLTTGIPTSVSQPTVTQTPNPNSLVNAQLTAYLNTNIAKLASSISVPDTAVFTAAFLQAPTGIPATSASSFMFFVNGQHVEPNAITSFVDNGNGTCTLVLDIGELGFNLIAADEVVAVGKFA